MGKAERMDKLKLAAENLNLWRQDIGKKLKPTETDMVRLATLERDLVNLALEALT